MTSPSEQTLLITGANGFLAGHVIKEALEQGYDIRGTVRSPESAKEVRDLFAEYAEDSQYLLFGTLLRKRITRVNLLGCLNPLLVSSVLPRPLH